MDHQRFDSIIRALTTATTRRGAVGILAGLIGIETADLASAKRRHKNRSRKKAKQRRQKRNRARVSAEKATKVGVCHNTGSEKNPLVFIEVDDNAVPAEHFTFSTMALPAGCEGPLHLHTDAEEVFFVLRGMPDLPTMAEAGIAGYSATSWNGMLAPAGVPAAIIKRLNDEFNRIIAEPDTRKRMLDNGYEPVGGPPEKFGAHIRAEIAKWAPVVKATGVRVD